MTEVFQYLVWLRKEVLSIIYGVSDADLFNFWDDESPNWLTRKKLKSLLSKALAEAEALGVYVATRHVDCGNPRHTRNANDGGMGYPYDSVKGMKIKYKDNRFIWPGDQLYQGKRYCKCPCSKNNQETSHHVIDDFIIERTADVDGCKAIISALSSITEAIENAGDRMPRSGIREHLLWSILEMNDRIMPQTVDQYIEERLGVASDDARRCGRIDSGHGLRIHGGRFA